MVTRTPFAQATLTCWPTFTPAVDGDDAPIAQVRSRLPSCRLIELALRARRPPPERGLPTKIPRTVRPVALDADGDLPADAGEERPYHLGVELRARAAVDLGYGLVE